METRARMNTEITRTRPYDSRKHLINIKHSILQLLSKLS